MSAVARRLSGSIVITCALLAWPANAAVAQSVSGSISGTAVDQSGQMMPGATVTLIDEQTGARRTLPTSDTGAFVLSAVQPGRYTVRIEMSGFTAVERKNITLPANERLSLGAITLTVGGVTETVTTTAQGSLVETTSSDRSALITSTQIDMVAVRGRDVMSLLRILPGVAYGGDIEAVGGSFGSTSPNISGNRATWNTMSIDGLVGPVPLPKSAGKDKVFFFYSFENWDSRVPQPVRRVTMPTALERQGDFSQSVNQSGALIVIRDPLTGQAFSGNRIPTNRINLNGQALLNVFP